MLFFWKEAIIGCAPDLKKKMKMKGGKEYPLETLRNPKDLNHRILIDAGARCVISDRDSG